MLVKAALSHKLINKEEPLLAVALAPADKVDNVSVPQLGHDFHLCLELPQPLLRLLLRRLFFRQHLDGHMKILVMQVAFVHRAKPSLTELVLVCEIARCSYQLAEAPFLPRVPAVRFVALSYYGCTTAPTAGHIRQQCQAQAR